MQATRLAQAKGADEALLVRPDGIVLEAPTSTIFWADRRASCAPPRSTPASSPRSPGTGSCGELDVVEGDFPLQDVLGASEAFLASTVREVQPVSAVDGTELPETPGPRTGEASEAFAAVLEREMGSTAARG